MRVVEVSADEVVGVIAMGYRLVATAGPMHVRGVMGAAGVLRRARRGILI